METTITRYKRISNTVQCFVLNYAFHFLVFSTDLQPINKNENFFHGRKKKNQPRTRLVRENILELPKMLDLKVFKSVPVHVVVICDSN